MAACRALVVDADWRMRRLIRTNLEAQGVEVAEVASGGECVRALAQQPCDLLLLSAELPDGNGWNIVGALRRTPATRDLPIVVITSEPARSRLLQRFQRVCPLVKPFSAADLLERVEWALAGQ
jgi:CheY-like chemotaxis protein